MLRRAFRKVLQQPFFTLLTVATLGIGIGAVATCFSSVNTLLFRPLPASPMSDRLVWLSQTSASPFDADVQRNLGFNYVDQHEVAQRAQTLSDIWVFTSLTVIVDDEQGPWRVLGTSISVHGFDALGVHPQLGRNLRASDMAADAPPVALISDEIWTSRFDRDPEILERSLELNGTLTRIVGVAPPQWRYPESSDVWLPLSPERDDTALSGFDQRGYFAFDAHGLLAPGVTMAEALTELSAIASDLAAEYPKTNDGVGLSVMSWRTEATRDARYFTLLLFAAGLVIFFIACANIANLQLARGSDRGPELAVRVALGATRWSLLRQLLLENMVLGMLGAIAGMVVGLWGVDWVRTSLETEHPFWLRFDPDWRVLTFTAGCGLVASFVFGLVPALRDSKPDVAAGLKESSRAGLDQGPFGQRLRNGIVIIEIALALVLLVGAGLLTRSFFKLIDVDPGYDAKQVLTFRAGFPKGYAADGNEAAHFFEELPRRLERLPEVEHAGAISHIPGTPISTVSAELRADPADANATAVKLERTLSRFTTAGYFETMRIPLVAGRDFAENQMGENDPVVIVDTAFAAAVGVAPADLLGRHVYAGKMAEAGLAMDGMKIIGVVGSIQHFLQQTDSIPTLYLPHLQEGANFMTVTVRTTGDPKQLADVIGNEVLAVHRGMPIYDVFTMEQVLLRSVWQPYFFSRLFLSAGIIAVLLACVGIYGVMTFNVSMRRHEIGLRMALGAPASEVVGDVVRRGLYLVVVGLGAGTIASVLLANLLSGTLHGITPHDLPTFLLVPVVLAAVALGACFLSSRRATHIDPMAAMRVE
ncbi:ABC transporter permease [Actomonas aquatica]|uniref:ABC transporter permease n=1 Tax=Actomonas aquatica TaxID=2866162 RepID=A0ABZ1CAX2_9BACT|nr:ABC transporter permease [Opitutus sp. WL0086]WRQ88373.1 ABC transporter permease [Opitutus sp. WL0086]